MKVFMALSAILILLVLSGCSEEENGLKADRDDTPPTMTGSFPTDGQVDVMRSGPYWFAFSEEMDVESVQDNTDSNPGFSYDMHTNASADTFWLTPHSALMGSTSYELTVGADCEDIAGNPMGADATIDFTTTAQADEDPPQLISTFPADGATGVNPGQALTITFSEPVSYPGSWGTQTAVSIDPYPNDGYFDREGSDLIVWHDPFPSDSLIEVTVTTDITDVSGNNLEAAHTFSFRTLDDQTRPYLSSASPANGATGVSPDISEVSVTFSEPMFPEFEMPPENVDAKLLLALSDEPEWDEDITEVTLSLERGLLAGCTYWVYFEDVTDMAGNFIDPNPTHYWFRTAGTVDYYPMGEGDLWYYLGGWVPLAKAPALDMGSDRRVIEEYSSLSGEFEEVWYSWDEGIWVIEEKTFLRDDGGTLYHLGREEYEDGSLDVTMMWDSPMPYLLLPPQNHLGESWNISTTADLGEGISMELEGTVEISAATTDVYVPIADAIFTDCIEWILSVEIILYDEETPFDSDEVRQTVYLSEGVGPVMRVDEDLDSPSEPDTMIVTGWDID
jgi:hypothetical protein